PDSAGGHRPDQEQVEARRGRLPRAAETEGAGQMKKQRAGVGVGSGNVFADLGFQNADEEVTKARLTAVIAKAVNKRRFKNQSEIAAALGIDQPKVSKLLRGH